MTIKIEYKHNQKAAVMEPLQLAKGLNFPHRSALERLHMLKNVALQSLVDRDGGNKNSLPFLLLGINSTVAPGKHAPASPTLLRNAHHFVMPDRDGVHHLQDVQDEVLQVLHVMQGKGFTNRAHCVPRVEKFYKEVVCFDLLLQCPLKGIMELSPPSKIVLNTSSKRVVQEKKELMVGLSACLMISGQRCQTTWARKSIAGFKLRGGSIIGCKVTLRGNSMYAFIDKLINLVLPRARPSSINQAIDPDGTYNIGISDPFVFVELEHHYDLFQSLQGVDVVLVMSPRERALVPLFWSGLQILTK